MTASTPNQEREAEFIAMAMQGSPPDETDADSFQIGDPIKLRPYLEGKGPASLPEHRRIPSPLTELNRYIHGFHRSRVAMIGGRRRSGQSALAVNFMTHAAGAGYATMLFRPGGDRREIGYRMIGSYANLDYDAIRRNAVTPGEFRDSIAKATRELRALDMTVATPQHADINDLRAAATEVNQTRGLDLLVVDTIQSLASTAQDRVPVMQQVARGLLEIARQLHTTVIAVTDLDSKTEYEQGLPGLKDLDDEQIGDLHYDAFLIMLLHRESHPWLATEADDTELVQIRIVKNSYGKCPTINAWFNPATARFFDYATQPPAPG